MTNSSAQKKTSAEPIFRDRIADQSALLENKSEYQTSSELSAGTEMDVISRLVKVQIPGYLRSLPIPGSVGGLVQLSGREWVQLIPVVVTTSVVVYLVISAFAPKKKDVVNQSIEKDKEKVASFVDIEDLGEKGVFCRCWRSKKFPLCDGSHNAHNKETGDNVGPLIVNCKTKEA